MDRPEEVGAWVCSRLGSEFNPVLDTAIGMESDGRIVGGVVFDNNLGRSVCIHVAGEHGHWMTRDFLRAAFGYPFNQLGVAKLIGPVDSDNFEAMRFDKNLGFVPEAVIKDAGRHGDLILMTMTRQQCRFLKD